MNHINILKYYDTIDLTDCLYIIMEYCEGDLSEILIKKPIKYDIVKYYFKQIISALKFLNENKIIHRDIKPKNILFTEDKKILKLSDFGFAKQINGLKKSNTMCGSPLYMAPEIFAKNGYTESVDMWSLGLILFEMIYGYHPLDKYKDIETISESIINTDIHIQTTDKITDDCIDLLKKLLNKNPIDRINMKDMLNHKWLDETIGVTYDELFYNLKKMSIYDNYLFINIDNLNSPNNSSDSSNSSNSLNSSNGSDSYNYNKNTSSAKTINSDDFIFIFE